MQFMGRGSARPSKFSSISGLIALMGILLSVVIGFLTSPSVGIVIFITTWVVLLILGLYQTIANVFGDKGVPHETSEFSGRASATASPKQPDFAEKLRDIQSLKDDGLITETEFNQKRAEILGEKW